ncbi:LacI family transcriptional regulator, partial [Escherichia coli]|nr:LacI family transcriptional regulator [Escherichia coli]
MSQPKLSDVAALAGVSPTTVSRVLNNRGYLSEKTRSSVFEAMKTLGYRPNAIARSLQGRKSQLIGLVFPSVAHPFYGEMAYRLESHLADAGYKTILCNSGDRPEAEQRYLDMLLANQVDGVITGAHSQLVAQFPLMGAPLVT